MIVWSEWETKQALGPDVPVPRELVTSDVDEATAFVAEVGPQVVAKASGVAHKTEGGLVRVGIDADELRNCFADLAAAGDGRVLVAELVRDAEYELIVGGLRDEVFGAVVAVGLGGIAAEVFHDTAFVLSPTTAEELGRGLDGLGAAGLLAGVRGRPPLDRQALHAIVTAVGDLLDREPDVTEVDCNPVMVVHGSPVVVDALATQREDRT